MSIGQSCGETLTVPRIGDIIRAAREDKNLSQAALARIIKTTRATVSSWENNKSQPTPKNARRLAQVLGIPLSTVGADPSTANVRLIDDPEYFRRVPLIDWIDAGKGAAAVDPYPVGEGVEYLSVHFKVSEGTFALEISGDSMSPLFNEGDRIIVDPATEPQPNDFVAVELLADGAELGSGEPVFKQYKPRGLADDGTPVFDLVPLNPNHDTITVSSKNPGRVLGKVVEHRKRY